MRPSALDPIEQDDTPQPFEGNDNWRLFSTPPTALTPSFAPQPSTFVPASHITFATEGTQTQDEPQPIQADSTDIPFDQFLSPVFPPPPEFCTEMPRNQSLDSNEVTPGSIDEGYATARQLTPLRPTSSSNGPRLPQLVAPPPLGRTHYSQVNDRASGFPPPFFQYVPDHLPALDMDAPFPSYVVPRELLGTEEVNQSRATYVGVRLPTAVRPPVPPDARAPGGILGTRAFPAPFPPWNLAHSFVRAPQPPSMPHDDYRT